MGRSDKNDGFHILPNLGMQVTVKCINYGLIH